MARWLTGDVNVLLLDEPTRGVDVGAKVEIYNIINSVTQNGGAVLMVSSELPEVIGMSDRILVMSGGRLAGELPRGASQDDIMALAVSNVDDAIVDTPGTVGAADAAEPGENDTTRREAQL